MADFNLAFQYMISNETYAPDDHRYGEIRTDNDGGLVRFGINSNTHKDLLTTSTFYTTMSNDEAIKVALNLYNTNEWKNIRGDQIQSQRVASKILDMAVNQGQYEALKLVQRAVGTPVDGVIGPVTILAINSTEESVLLKGLVYWWLWFIEKVIINNPEDKPYEAAWTTRADKLPTAA